ncbi:hypothetical protein OAC15_04045 [Alphaproteobacteria bacterium]|nr:hypothetical protein [Alphaproteobacteria bacterium]
MNNINFGSIYESQKINVTNYIKSLDRKSGFFRSTDDLKDLVQSYFLEIFENKYRDGKTYKTIDKYDPSRANDKSHSGDPIFKFLIGSIKNFYKKSRKENIRYLETKKALLQEHQNKITNFHNKAAKNLDLDAKENYRNKILNNDTEELSFCYDVKKLSSSFVKNLKGLELKTWKFFILEEMTPLMVAKHLGFSERTAYNLRNSINSKAQEHMETFYAS